MSEVQQYHKKKNLFKFFKSKEFNEARVKMCALYILISYCNELHEDVDRLLKGFDGMMIGMLKHKAKAATKATAVTATSESAQFVREDSRSGTIVRYMTATSVGESHRDETDLVGLDELQTG